MKVQAPALTAGQCPAGDAPYNSVLSFQKDNGLTPDGMVGPNTLSKLGISRSGGGSGTISATLRKGSNGSLTRYLQRILSALGYKTTAARWCCHDFFNILSSSSYPHKASRNEVSSIRYRHCWLCHNTQFKVLASHMES